MGYNDVSEDDGGIRYDTEETGMLQPMRTTIVAN